MSTIDKILQLVDESGLKAKEYAINAGLGAGNITDWKTGRSKPSVESLQKIAKYAGVQLEWLTGDSEFKTQEDLFNEFSKQFEEYSQNLYHLDVSNAVIMSTVTNFLLKDKNLNYYKYLSYIKNFFLGNSLNKISNAKIKKFVKDFPEDEQNNLIFIINDILKEIRLQQKSRENYYSFKTSLVNKNIYNCPVYGRISAGIPNWAEECLESHLPLDPDLMNINNPEECFFLRVNGESMNKLVRNGAYALIRRQDVVENGDIAVVLVDNYDATLKKFTKHGDVVVLEPMSDDPNFQTQIYDKNTDIKILGKYLGKFELN